MTKMAVLGRGSMRDKQKVRIIFTIQVLVIEVGKLFSSDWSS